MRIFKILVTRRELIKLLKSYYVYVIVFVAVCFTINLLYLNDNLSSNSSEQEKKNHQHEQTLSVNHNKVLNSVKAKTTTTEQESDNIEILNIKSYCKCRDDIVVKKKSYYKNIYEIKSSKNNQDYFIHYDKDVTDTKTAVLTVQNSINSQRKSKIDLNKIFINPRFTCDLDKELTHGPNQKVISYAFYGTNYGYFNNVENIIRSARRLFPGWIVRIYYEKTFNKSIICYLECKYDSVYFCNTNKIPFKTDNTVNLFDSFSKNSNSSSKHGNDLTYVHGMMWRWFPISDDFVDYFSSRDTDSNLIQREKDAVDDWMKSKKLFHIIRDNPYHNIHILGGLWSHANYLDRVSGYNIYKHFLEQSTQRNYNPNGQHFKNFDQSYLSQHVWPLANANAKIHDAYNCQFLGGEPFPTRRPSNKYCFISCFEPCCDEALNQTARMPTCPMECRPKDHKDWDTC